MFKEIERRSLADIQSQGIMYEHEQTGAKVLWLANEDVNKAFMIGFKTPPYDDNGIAHIIEHSVLNGSKQYPSKEPFVELIKGSLNTFVNAITFSDKTIYPVASTNQQDFHNLMSVYLDAVFAPNFYHDTQILQQEGWHYHLETAEDELIYKGVVYNEMKGALASSDHAMYREIGRALYPDSIYALESGGDPASIISLTQEAFVDFHQTYYHPSNSFTVIYGDVDQTQVFETLEAYFANFERQTQLVDLKIDLPIPSQTYIETPYSIPSEDEAMNKDFLALAWHVALPDETLDSYGLRVLAEILFGNNQAPLKKVLLEADIAGTIEVEAERIGYPMAFSIIGKYSQKTAFEQFKALIFNTLQQLVKDGIPERLVEAALNKTLFEAKEAAISESNPRGVIYALNSISGWQYEASPYSELCFTEPLDQLRTLAKDSYFEDLIQRKLIDNAHCVGLALVATPGLNDQEEAKEFDFLQALKASWSDAEIQQVVAQTQALITRQNTPDKAEDLAKIPMLERSDLQADFEIATIESEKLGQVAKLFHADQFTSGIDYFNYYFDVSDFAQADYAALSLLASLLGKLPTQAYDIAALRTEIDIHTGGIGAGISIYEDQDQQLKPYFLLKGKALAENANKLHELLLEILSQTQLNQPSEILNIIHSLISNFEQEIAYSAHMLAANRAMSQLKPAIKLQEATKGIDYFNYLKACREQLQAGESQALVDHLGQLLARLNNQSRIHLLYIGQNEERDRVKALFETSLGQLKISELDASQTYVAGQLQKEAFVAAQDVNYVALGADASKYTPFSGKISLVGNLINYSYLWNTVRVQGGAYGCVYRQGRNGSLLMASYRDPNLMKTIETYQAIPEFLRQLDLSEQELTKSMIGAFSNIDQPLSAYDKGLQAFSMQHMGIDAATIRQHKQEILATSLADIQSYGSVLKDVLQKTSTVVIGNKAKIESESDYFELVAELF